MGRRIGKPQTPTKAGYSDVFDTRQHQKYVKDNILANPKDDAIGSVRFDGTDYLRRAPSATGNRKTWTWSGWVKPQDFTDGSIDCIWSQQGGTATSQRTALYNNGSDAYLIFTQYTGTANDFTYQSTQVFRDFNSWYHIVIAADTTLAVAADRIKIYVNSVLITDFSTETDPSQNLDTYVNNGTYEIQIGQDVKVASRYYSGYLSNFTLVDGLQLDPTYFGYTDRETGQWKPKRYTGNFGTNGFHLPMSGDFRAGYVRAGIGDYDNTNLENNKADIYSATAATFTSVWKAHEGKWGKSSWGNNHGKIELTADDAYNLKDVSATPFTIEGWSKFVEEDGVYPFFVSFGDSDYNAWSLWYNGNVDGFYVTVDTSGGSPWDIDTYISLDPYDGEWHHWAYTRNTSGQYKFHYDGEYKGIIATNTNDIVTNNNTLKIFSHYSDSTQSTASYQNPFVYHDSMRMIKGQDLYGTSDIAGWSADIWNIASTKETYVGSGTDLTGTVSFLLPPNRYDAPFKEISGKNNNYVIEGHRSYDGVEDSPQNTFATLNNLDTDVTLAEGNLHAVDIANYNDAPATLGMTSSKWYFEGYVHTVGTTLIGITRLSNSGKNHTEVDSLRSIYQSTGTIWREGTNIGNTTGLASYTTGDVIGVCLNVDKGELSFYKNGLLVLSTTDVVYRDNSWKFYVGVGGTADWVVNFGQDATFAGGKTALAKPYTDANGIGEFYYPPPDGALALCTKNIEGGLSNTTTTKKYYNKDETGKVLSYSGYNPYTYGTINDERFSDLSPYTTGGGKSFHFDGVSELVNSPASSDHNIGTGAFTMEIWFKTTTTSTDTFFRRMILLDGPTGNASGNVQLSISSDGYVNGWTNTSDLDLRSATGFNDGLWHHAAMVRSGTTVTLYVDGTSVDTATYGTAISPNSGSPRPRLGSYDGTLGDWDGYLTDARIVVGTAVYTGNFTVPSAPLGTTQSSGTNIAAITGTATSFLAQPYNTETVNNTPPMYTRDETGLISFSYGSGLSFANISPYEDNSVKSFRFKNGTSNDIGLKPENYTPNFDANDFTMEWWFKPNTITGSYVGMHWAGSSSSSGADELHVAFQSSKIHLYLNQNWVDTSYTPKLNEWQHLAIVRDYGTSLKMYINGVEQYSTTTNASISNNYDGYNDNTTYTSQMRFGMHSGYGFYDGLMCDIRMTSGVAIYTSDFTPPAYKLRSDFYTTDGTDPASSGTRSAFSSGQVRLLAQPYSQPAQIHDVGSKYRTNRIYLTDETGKNLIHG